MPTLDRCALYICFWPQAERKTIASKVESVAATTAERDEGEAGVAEGETEIGTAEDKIENGGTAQEEACTAS